MDDKNRLLLGEEIGQVSGDPSGLFHLFHHSIYTTQVDLLWDSLQISMRVSAASQVPLITFRKGCHIPGTTDGGRVVDSQMECFSHSFVPVPL